MTEPRITWHPRIIYRGLATRVQMRSALGSLTWATQKPVQYIARIHKIRDLRIQGYYCCKLFPHKSLRVSGFRKHRSSKPRLPNYLYTPQFRS